ncbi:MAG: CvpA family protein [Treponema sp.]|nr:CvpA family protein [Candidatus Treponema equi]
MSLPIIDLVFCVLVFVLALIGLFNGFINEVMGKVIPFISIWVAFVTFGHLVGPLEKHINIHIVAVICAFLIIFMVVFILLKIVQHILKGLFSNSILKSLDRFLGFVFGIVEALAVICIVLLVLYAQPWFNTDPLLKGSLFARFLGPIVKIPANAITESVKEPTVMVMGLLGVMNV